MDFRYTTADGINDVITGAVISHSDVNDNGVTLYFEDGRALVFPEACYFAVVYTRGIVQ